jgi:pimeloyl-ACP methyl ester carboxylesterase
VRPHGYALGEIAVPALIWHGRQDRFVPVAHGEWLATAIPGAEARITEEDGHLTLLMERIPAVHEWLLARV